MKHFFANLGVNLVALACVGVGGYLCVQDKDGWGWFLFVAVLACGTAKLKE